MSINGPQIYFTIPLFGGIPITQTTVSSWIVTVLLCVAGIILGRGLKKRPTGRQVIVEKAYLAIRQLVVEAMGEHNAHWTPYIATLFLSSICGTLIGMTGFLRSTTADLSTTATWAVTISVLVWYHSIRNFGLKGWLKGFTEPVAIMTPMNIVSEFAQPLSLSFRHFGNIVGGSVITAMVYWALSGASTLILRLAASSGIVMPLVCMALGIFLLITHSKKKERLRKILGALFVGVGIAALLQATGLLPGIPILQIGLPAILSLYFDLFSGFIQAFVFSLLSMIYISNACPEPATPQEAPETV